jgi:hypothetical protein
MCKTDQAVSLDDNVVFLNDEAIVRDEKAVSVKEEGNCRSEKVISLEQHGNFPDSNGVSLDDIDEGEDTSGVGIPRAADGYSAAPSVATAPSEHTFGTVQVDDGASKSLPHPWGSPPQEYNCCVNSPRPSRTRACP